MNICVYISMERCFSALVPPRPQGLQVIACTADRCGNRNKRKQLSIEYIGEVYIHVDYHSEHLDDTKWCRVVRVRRNCLFEPAERIQESVNLIKIFEVYQHEQFHSDRRSEQLCSVRLRRLKCPEKDSRRSRGLIEQSQEIHSLRTKVIPVMLNSWNKPSTWMRRSCRNPSFPIYFNASAHS